MIFMKETFRSWGLILVRACGTTITDAQSQQFLGKAFIFLWRGRIHLIGYEGPPIIPHFLPQKKVTYWRSTIGFKKMAQVDFPSIVSTNQHE